MAKIGLATGLLLSLSLFAAPVQATLITDAPGNHTLATAQNVDASFSLDLDPLIGDMTVNTSTAIPHVSISGTGDELFDYFAFTVSAANSRVILDVDSANVDFLFDSHLRLFNPGGVGFISNNDSPTTYGAAGSEFTDTDSYIETILTDPGIYIVQVGRWNSGIGDGDVITDGDTYLLHISLEPGQVAEPRALALFAFGLLGLAAIGRFSQTGRKPVKVGRLTT